MESNLSWDVRFWERVSEQADGCWAWTGHTNNGYGRVTRYFRNFYAHRYSLLQHGIEVPADREVDHLCRNRRCVNPSHLEIVTTSVNIVRSLPYKDTGRLGRWHLAKTHCPQGHPYGGDNLYIRTDGGRECRTCRRAHVRRFKERQAA